VAGRHGGEDVVAAMGGRRAVGGVGGGRVSRGMIEPEERTEGTKAWQSRHSRRKM
jgi:hypothetical protein